MTTPWHPAPGGVVTFPGWGPAPPDPADPAVARKTERVLAWLIAQGASTPSQTFERLSFPGQPPGPVRAYFHFERAGFEDVTVELGGMLEAPHVTLGQLMVAHHFGNPFAVPVYSEPSPPAPPAPQGAPRPADPVGEPVEGAPGRYHSLPGDDWELHDRFTRSTGEVFEKRGNRSPFGWFVWWERVT